MISPTILILIFIYLVVIVKLSINYLNRPKEKSNSYIKFGQTGLVEFVFLVALISIIVWSLRETSKKNQIKGANKYLATQNHSKAVDILIGIKDWERAAETIVKAPQGTQILLLRRLQSHISQSVLKNIFLKIGDKYRNTHYSELSAISYQLAEMPWRAAQSYISMNNVQAAIDIINTSQVFANDRNRAIRNLAKFAYDTNHPLESARLLQSIGAEDEAKAVLIATGKEGSLLKKDYKEEKEKTVHSKPSRKSTGEIEKVPRASPFIMLQKELSLVQKSIQEGNINIAQNLLEKSNQLIEKIPVGESKEVLELKHEYTKISEAIKRLVEARNAFKQNRIEESQILYSELIDYAGERFNAEVYAEAGLVYESSPSDFELVHEYFLEASKKAKTTQAEKNYKERANKALRFIQTGLPEAEEDIEYESERYVGKIINVNTSESCSVCKRPIGSGEVVQCTQCKSISHFPHIGEWLKIKGVCPVCKQKMTLPEKKKVAITE